MPNPAAVGDVVRFMDPVIDEGPLRAHAAIVTHVGDGAAAAIQACHLFVITSRGTFFVADVPFAADKQPRTWHWAL